MFKNLVLYRYTSPSPLELEALVEALAKAAFSPCGQTQPVSAGWVPPRDELNAPLVESISGQLIMKLQTEKKILPGDVVKRKVEQMSALIENKTGRKPGKRQLKEIKEQVILELLPAAFTKISTVKVWLSDNMIALDVGTHAAADDVITLLVRAVEGMSVSALATAMSPAAGMGLWLASSEPPTGFTVDRECELESPDETKAVVRYTRHSLDTDDIRGHIEGGKVPTRLALTWNGRVSFVLTNKLALKKIEFLDGVFEGVAEKDGFDADVAIATGELLTLIPDLIEALGGEMVAEPAGGEA